MSTLLVKMGGALLLAAVLLRLAASEPLAASVVSEICLIGGALLALIAVIAKATQYAPLYRCVTCGEEARCRPGQTVCDACKEDAERNPADLRR